MSSEIRILLADSDRSFCNRFCAAAKEMHKCEVIATAEDGVQLMQLVDELSPDAVVVDLFLTRLDGLSAIKELKMRENCPIIIATSLFTTEYIEATMKVYTVNAFFLKPFENSMVLRCIQEEMKNRRTVTHANVLHEMQVANVLKAMGVGANNVGYRYLRHAIVMTIDDATLARAASTRLYPAVAACFNTTTTKVERAIRHTVELAWQRSDPVYLEEYLGNALIKPGTAGFIASVAKKVRNSL